MKRSELSFAEGFTSSRSNNKNAFKVFDWDQAANIIKENLKLYPDLTAEAGLQGDWNYTGDIIFENNTPNIDCGTYLRSNWAVPTLLLFVNGVEIEEIPCYTEDVNTRFTQHSKWDETSLAILKSE